MPGLEERTTRSFDHPDITILVDWRKTPSYLFTVALGSQQRVPLLILFVLSTYHRGIIDSSVSDCV